MEKLLINYLNYKESRDYIEIETFKISGAYCEVVYFDDEDIYFKKRITKTINIWDMLIFLNPQE